MAATVTSPLHPLTERILAGTAPEPLCLAAARGALPVPPEELLRARVHLARHGEGTAAATSRDALLALPAAEVIPLITVTDCAPDVLDWFARSRAADEAIMAAVVPHPAVPDDSLVVAAAEAGAPILERLLDNQERLLRVPTLLDALEANPALAPDARGRLLDVRDELARRQRRRPARPAPAPVVPAAPLAGEPAAAGAPPAEPEVGEEPAGSLDPEAAPSDGVFQRIVAMDVPDKQQLAMKGNREERAILIRDVVRVVALAVLKNPRLTEQEIETMAGLRSVQDDVIRTIADSREWTKNYPVVLALCRNPKTPIRRTLGFLPRLSTRDLKILAADRGIPDSVRTQASRAYVIRTQPKTGLGKKKH